MIVLGYHFDKYVYSTDEWDNVPALKSLVSKPISIRNKAVVLQSANTARKYLPTACTTYSINNPNADRQELAVSDLIEKYRYKFSLGKKNDGKLIFTLSQWCEPQDIHK